MINRQRFIQLFIIWYVLIWVVSSIPSKALINIDKLSMDKLAHFFVYLVLGILYNRVMQTSKVKRKHRIPGYVLLLISASLEEYHQKWIPGRSVSVYDLAANSLGLFTALLLGLRRDKSK